MKFMSRDSKPGIPFLVLGVLFPAAVLVLEVTTNMCGEMFFDPVPTYLHVLLVALVPAANLLVWLVARGYGAEWIKAIGLLNGVAVGISAFYCVLFIPLVPVALIAILWGLGLLPLAPFFSLWAAIRARLYLRANFQNTAGHRLHGVWFGIALSFVAIVVAELPGTVTRVGLKLASSPKSETRLTGIRLLRNFGSQDLLQRACYRRSGLMTDPVSALVSVGDPLLPAKAREVYYQVTGQTFNSVPVPRFATRFGLARYRGPFDPVSSARSIGPQVPGLSLESSRLDGSLDSDAALGYLQWTLEFRNESDRQQEARAQILLPQGAVVSRLTLWIDGEEREAAFAARGQVSKAYQEVVRKRRDPVLVTTNGPDRILMQCFPVEPRGGTMKIRMGITLPMHVMTRETAQVRLPSVLERNFDVPDKSLHLIWIESKHKLGSKASALVPEKPSPEVFALRGSLSEQELNDPAGAVVIADRNPQITKAWNADLGQDDGEAILQSVTQQPVPMPRQVVLVIDGSLNMARFRKEIIDALDDLPEGIEIAALVASDDVIEIAEAGRKGSKDLYEMIGHRIAGLHFLGGCDNLPALARAWDLATKVTDSAVVWIHSPQPLLMEPVETLKQRWERRPDGPMLYEIQTANGPNRIIENLECLARFQSIPRFGKLSDDLRRFFDGWRLQNDGLRLVRHRTPLADVPFQNDVKHTSPHLVRLWAYGEVLRLCSLRGSETDSQAVALAAKYQLVTPKTGAVVLETTEQFQRHGLTPASAATVPTIPEPEFWMLMAVVAALLAFLIHRSRTWSLS